MISPIIHNFSSVADLLLALLCKQLVFSTLIFVIIYGLSFALRKASSYWHMGLWILVLIRLLLPPDVSSPFNAVNMLNRIPLVQQSYHWLADIFNSVPQETSPDAHHSYHVGVLSIAGEQSVNMEKQGTTNRPVLFKSFLFIAWISGVLFFMFLYVKRHRSYALILKNARPLDQPEIEQIAAKWLRYFNIRKRVRVVHSPHLLSPFTMGIRKPVVYLPEEVLQIKDKTLLDSIIGHELAHIRRFDNLWIKLQNAIQIIYFFHPIVWYTNSRIHLARECICDSMVLGKKDISRERYGQGIITILKLNLFGAEGLCLFSGFGNHKNKMAYRLQNLRGERDMIRRNRAGLYAVIIILGLFILPISGSALKDSMDNSTADAASGQNEVSEKASVDKSGSDQGKSSTTLKSDKDADIQFGMPLRTGRVTARYGKMIHPYRKELVKHKGIDIAAKSGTEVLAAAKGTAITVVTDYEKNKGHGIRLIIQHENGFQSSYSHLDTVLVKQGQAVNAGDSIAKVGSTGASTGPHLHFEIRLRGETQDPEEHISFEDLVKP